MSPDEREAVLRTFEAIANEITAPAYQAALERRVQPILAEAWRKEIAHRNPASAPKGRRAR